jgi:dolichol-phosphate mannosyltransferase
VRLVVCVPTYDERENLEPMVRALGAVLAETGTEGRVLVIDDALNDGTGTLVNRLADEVGLLDALPS